MGKCSSEEGEKPDNQQDEGISQGYETRETASWVGSEAHEDRVPYVRASAGARLGMRRLRNVSSCFWDL